MFTLGGCGTAAVWKAQEVATVTPPQWMASSPICKETWHVCGGRGSCCEATWSPCSWPHTWVKSGGAGVAHSPIPVQPGVQASAGLCKSSFSLASILPWA